MSNIFEDMTNTELKEACEDFGLSVAAKNPAKPNKTEYLEALNAFKAVQDATHGVEEEEIEVKKVKAPTRKQQSASQLMKLELDVQLETNSLQCWQWICLRQGTSVKFTTL